MKSFSNLSIEEQNLIVEKRFVNAKNNPKIMSALGIFNLGEDYIVGGLNLVMAARTATDRQKSEYFEQYSATNARDEGLAAVEDNYKITSGLLEIILSDDEQTAAEMKLGIALPVPINKRIDRLRYFYSTLVQKPQLCSSLAVYGRTAQVIDGEIAAVDNLIALQQKAMKETGEAQRSTQERNAAVELMIKKDREFQKFLRMALGNDNDLLEVVGLFVRSGK